jgi:hypothetical protein
MLKVLGKKAKELKVSKKELTKLKDGRDLKIVESLAEI